MSMSDKKLSKAVKQAWSTEIVSDLFELLCGATMLKQYTNIINEGWLPAGGKDFSYYVGVNEDHLWVEVYENQQDFEEEKPCIAEYRIDLKIKSVTRA